VLFVIGVLYWLILQQMNLRSPRAVAFVPPGESGESSEPMATEESPQEPNENE
jgi:hypothetical protein